MEEQNHNTSVPPSEPPKPTQEEINAKIKEIQTAVQVFVQDHPLYVLCSENRVAIDEWMQANHLEYSAENLDKAYQSLGKKLRLYAESKLTEEAPRPKYDPEATALNVDIASQQRARRDQSLEGPRSSSRDAFVTAGQNKHPRITGRVHL